MVVPVHTSVRADGPFKQRSPAVPDRFPFGLVWSVESQMVTVFEPSVCWNIDVNFEPVPCKATFVVLIGTAPTAAELLFFTCNSARADVLFELSCNVTRVPVVNVPPFDVDKRVPVVRAVALNTTTVPVVAKFAVTANTPTVPA